MKKRMIGTKRLIGILAAAVLCLALIACGKTPSLITESNEETGGLEVTADRVSETGNSGTITIGEGQCLVVSPMLEKGHLLIRVVAVDAFNTAMDEEMRDLVSEGEPDFAVLGDGVVLEEKIEGKQMSAYSAAPGEYYVFVNTEKEKTTGTASIMPYDIEELRKQDAALADTLEEIPDETGISPTSEETEETPEAGSTGFAVEVPQEDGQNPVMNFVGPYGWARASAQVEAGSGNEAKIRIHWGSSAAEFTEWVMSGEFDSETLTVEYTDCVKTNYAFNEDGEIDSEEVVYENGTGSITFQDGSPITFTWKDDMENVAEDAVFEWNF